MNTRLRNKRIGSFEVLNEYLNRIPTTSNFKYLVLRGKYAVPPRSGVNSPAQLGVPPGSRNITMLMQRGAVVSATGPVPDDPNLHDSMAIGSLPGPVPISGTTIVTAVAGSSTITMPGIGTPPDVGKWYFLYDKDKEETNGADSSTRKVGGEIVKVVSVSGVTITLDKPITQTYSGIHVILADIDALICQNITIQGGTFTGLREGKFGAGLRARLVVGLKIVGASAFNCQGAGIHAELCRDVTITQCRSEGMGDNNTGSGYAYLLDRSTRVNVGNCVAHVARVGTLLDCGPAKVEVAGFLGSRCKSNLFDVHGGDAYDCSAIGVYGSGPVRKNTVGNINWRLGAQLITINRCGMKDLTLQGNLTDISVENSTTERVIYESTSADPTFTGDVTLTNLSVTDSGVEVVDTAEIDYCIKFLRSGHPMRFNPVTFTNCSIKQPDSRTGFAVMNSDMCEIGAIAFDNCSIWCKGLTATTVGALTFGPSLVGVSGELNVDAIESQFVLPSARAVAKGWSGTYCTFSSSLSGRSTDGTTFTALSSADVTGMTWV